MSEHYDVIIIGTGAGGGTLAHRLAPSGKRVLLLERGGYLPREPENWDSKEVFLKSRYVTPEKWIDGNGTPFRPQGREGAALKFRSRSPACRRGRGCRGRSRPC